MRAAIILIGLGLVFGFPTNVQALDPDVKCNADKVKETAKYSACLLKAESKAIKKGGAPDFSKCDSKYSEKWQKAEDKAGGECPSTGDEAVIQSQVQQCVDDLVAALGPCPGGAVNVGGACWYLGGDNESCNQVCANLGLVYDAATETYAGSGGTLANCDAVLTALSLDTATDFVCLNGSGCIVITNLDLNFRCTDPPTTSFAANMNTLRACACQP